VCQRRPVTTAAVLLSLAGAAGCGVFTGESPGTGEKVLEYLAR
jgi:hypothetical protein